MSLEPRQQALKLVEYLLALKNLEAPVAVDLRESREPLWWWRDLPVGEGCVLHPPEQAAWLEVHKQVVPAAPPPPAELADWLMQPWDDPRREPLPHPLRNLLTPAEEAHWIQHSTAAVERAAVAVQAIAAAAPASDVGPMTDEEAPAASETGLPGDGHAALPAGPRPDSEASGPSERDGWPAGAPGEGPALSGAAAPARSALPTASEPDADDDSLAPPPYDAEWVAASAVELPWEVDDLAALAARRRVSFEADPARVAALNAWLETAWRPWAQAAGQRGAVQALYGQLFALYQRLQRERETIELVMGHGLLTWRVAGQKIRRPVLTTRVDLQFDAQRGVFTLAPALAGTVLELDMLTAVPVPNPAHLVRLEQAFEESPLDPWDSALTAPFYRELAQTLDPDGAYRADTTVGGADCPLAAHPVIWDLPVLFVRRGGGRQWQAELKGLTEALRNGAEVPAPVLAITAAAPPTPDAAAAEAWRPVGEDLLFPLAWNEEQREIVRRLSQHCGVVVQGPPGTGKSHTIVNLIAHLLAHGKRVLVTSETERALRVIGDMVREKVPAIAPLCVSLLEGDSRSVKELEEAITGIADRLDADSIETLEARIAALREEQAQLQTEQAELRRELAESAEAEHAELSWHGQTRTPMELARWLQANASELGWLPDQPDPGSPPPLDEVELARWLALLGEIDPQDRRAAALHRPALESLPTTPALAELLDHLTTFERGAEARTQRLTGWQLPAVGLSDVQQALQGVAGALERAEPLQAPWLRAVMADVSKPDGGGEAWHGLLEAARERRAALRQSETQLRDWAFSGDLDADTAPVQAALQLVRDELSRGEGLGFMFRHFTGKSALAAIAPLRVNGAPPRTREEVEALLAWLAHREACRKLAIKWNNHMRDIEGPWLEPEAPRFLATLSEHLEHLAIAVAWESEVVRPIQSALCEIAPPGLAQWHEPAWLQVLHDGLLALRDTLQAQSARASLDGWRALLEAGARQPEPHPAWEALAAALAARDLNRWGRERDALVRLAAQAPKLSELTALGARLEAAAPNWMHQFEARAARGEALSLPGDWRAAWEWAQANVLLETHLARRPPEVIHLRLAEVQRITARLTGDLVAATTWLAQLRRTTPAQRRGLLAWLQTIRKIGKGTGKYADRHREHARREMDTCRGAVPVWIMPLNRVVENLKPNGERFDVVIVDESSQCDLNAISALFRAERAVIVGDDKQISPEGVGRDQSEVNLLIERHLQGIPQRHLFTLQNSLYDTAVRVFASTLMLREHFRCVPEIIRFSNERFYGGVVEPLRMPLGSQRFDPPLRAVYVPDGIREGGTARSLNLPEAEALVETVVRLCQDPAYEDRTMGVIALQGKEQAQLIEQRLRQRLGEREMVERRIVCGDAYSFQGDERDVMFLSLVAAPNVRNMPLTKRTDENRFNVAASRARDQVWLFHSVGLEHLHPACMRHQLLQHFLTPEEKAGAEQLGEARCESELERDVFRRLSERGYRVQAQQAVGSGNQRIDLVVEGARARLALSCEGDRWHGLARWEAAQRRQAVLERVGWRFCQVRGSAFYRDPARALAPIWEALADLGIQPEAGAEAGPVEVLLRFDG
ncbi:MAG: AAA domain-containing protein [Candidatus Sericytochromatia bacterium]|nr:AAA domain-containing protein [Candidatus Sericytochromatia bacterium]